MSAMDSEETPKTSSKKPPTGINSIDTYAVQCDECQKWRVINSVEEFEDIRSKLSKEPFNCRRISGVTCDDPADIEYDNTRTWVIDKPNVQKTPEGFKRQLVLRRDYSKLDTYYLTPQGKRIRTRNEMAAFLKGNPMYEGLSASDFDFANPKVMYDTIPESVSKRVSSSSNKKPKTQEE